MANLGTVREVVGDYTCVGNDQTVIVDASGGNCTVTLPTESASSGRIIVVVKSESSVNTVTIAAPGGYSIVSLADMVLRLEGETEVFELGQGTVWYEVAEEAGIALKAVKLQSGTPIYQTGISAVSEARAISAMSVGDHNAAPGTVPLVELSGITGDIMSSDPAGGQLLTLTDNTTASWVSSPYDSVFTDITTGNSLILDPNQVALANPIATLSSNYQAGKISVGNGFIGSVRVDGTDTLDVSKLGLYVQEIQVVGSQKIAVADATGAGDVVAQLNLLLAAIRAHGLIAT